MRIENPLLSQSLIESLKPADNKEVTNSDSKQDPPIEESRTFVPSLPGSSGIYSVSSLKAAVELYAKFLTVAESNLQAIRHKGLIPQMLLDRLNGQ